jgi:hypothetical protein
MRMLAPIGGGGAAEPFDSTQVLRFAKGQPTLVDAGGVVDSWSYDEATGVLEVNTVSGFAAPTSILDDGPLWFWDLTDWNGTVIDHGDEWMSLPFIQHCEDNESGQSYGVGLAADATGSGNTFMGNLNMPSAGGNTSVSAETLISGAFVQTTPDSAPSAALTGMAIAMGYRQPFGVDRTVPSYVFAEGIATDGQYDNGHEMTITSSFWNNFPTSGALKLVVGIGCQSFSGGTGSVSGAAVYRCVVGHMTPPSRPALLSSNMTAI